MPVNTKQARRAAAEAEAQRRWREAEANSPLTRDDFQSLLDAVAMGVAEHGHDNSFACVDAWLAERSIASAPVHGFLKTHHVHDDYGLIIGGDPYTLFGPTEERLRWMPVSRKDLDELIAAVEDKLAENSCDHTHRFTRQFLVRRGLPLGTTEMALLAQGGGCDCEMVLNVEASTSYPRVNRPR
jgi:hypothetical protein